MANGVGVPATAVSDGRPSSWAPPAIEAYGGQYGAGSGEAEERRTAAAQAEALLDAAFEQVGGDRLEVLGGPLHQIGQGVVRLFMGAPRRSVRDQLGGAVAEDRAEAVEGSGRCGW